MLSRPDKMKDGEHGGSASFAGGDDRVSSVTTSTDVETCSSHLNETVDEHSVNMHASPHRFRPWRSHEPQEGVPMVSGDLNPNGRRSTGRPDAKEIFHPQKNLR